MDSFATFEFVEFDSIQLVPPDPLFLEEDHFSLPVDFDRPVDSYGGYCVIA